MFDEDDALFGKRSNMKESYDHYANIEISCLLSRMEVYRGLLIHATKMKGYMDQAFLRRVRFIVVFPLPERQEWQTFWEGCPCRKTKLMR